MKPGDMIKYRGKPAMVTEVQKRQYILGGHNNVVACSDEVTIFIFDADTFPHYTRIYHETGRYNIDLPEIWWQTHVRWRDPQCQSTSSSTAPNASGQSPTLETETGQSQKSSASSVTPEASQETSVQPTVSSDSLPNTEEN